MSHNGFGTRLVDGARDPWTLLVSAFGAGVCWALGNPVSTAVAAACTVFGTAVLVSAFARRAAPVVTGTRQRALATLFDGHAQSLRGVRTDALPDVIRAKAADAVAAAEIARPSVLQMTSVVDALDGSIAAARRVPGQSEHAAESIGKSVDRMMARRAAVLSRLEAAVDEVATVYTGLLELSATAVTIGIAPDDREVAAVNDSVTLLQMTFAELEQEAAALSGDGL